MFQLCIRSVLIGTDAIYATIIQASHSVFEIVTDAIYRMKLLSKLLIQARSSSYCAVFMNIYFVSRYSLIPRGLPSVPIPLSFTSPKGATVELMIPSLTPTIPTSNLCANEKALDRSLVQK